MMPVIRLQVINSCPIVSRNAIRPSLVHLTPIFRPTCLRKYAQSSSPVPPPQPSTTTSQSSGLNHQLHPEGRPPLSPKPRPASTTAQSTPKTEPNVTSTSAPETPSPAVYRTPLRATSSNTPVAAKDTVKLVYEGPLRKTVRGLKAFSVSSLIISATMTPFILTLEAPIPMVARVAMVGTALGASILSTGLIHYFLSPYVARATYMALSHQLNLENYSIFARRKTNVVNVDDLRRIEGEGYRITANLKNDADGKVWYVHPEPEVSAQFWETLDRPRGGYKDVTGKTITYKAKVGDNPESRMFEHEKPVINEKESTRSGVQTT